MALAYGYGCVAYKALQPPFCTRWESTGYIETKYLWRNGLAVKVTRDGSVLPYIDIETGVDVSRWLAFEKELATHEAEE